MYRSTGEWKKDKDWNETSKHTEHDKIGILNQWWNLFSKWCWDNWGIIGKKIKLDL